MNELNSMIQMAADKVEVRHLVYYVDQISTKIIADYVEEKGLHEELSKILKTIQTKVTKQRRGFTDSEYKTHKVVWYVKTEIESRNKKVS